MDRRCPSDDDCLSHGNASILGILHVLISVQFYGSRPCETHCLYGPGMKYPQSIVSSGIAAACWKA